MQNASKIALFLVAPSLGALMWLLGAPWQMGAFFVVLGGFGAFFALARRARLFAGFARGALAAALLLGLSGCGEKNEAAADDAPPADEPKTVYASDAERRMADPAYVAALDELAKSRVALEAELGKAAAALAARVEALEKAAPEGKEWDQADSEYLRLKAEEKAAQAKVEALNLKAQATVRAKIKEGGEEALQKQRAENEARQKQFEAVRAKAKELNAEAAAIGTPEAKEKAAKAIEALAAPLMTPRNPSGARTAN